MLISRSDHLIISFKSVWTRNASWPSPGTCAADEWGYVAINITRYTPDQTIPEYMGPASILKKNSLGLNADHSSAAFPLPLVGSNSDFRQADDWWEQQQTTGEGHRLFLPNWFCQTFVSSNYAAVQFMHHRVVLLARKKSATVDCHQTLLIANLPWQNASWPLVMSILSKRFGHFVLGEFFSRLMVHHAPKKKIHRHAT